MVKRQYPSDDEPRPLHRPDEVKLSGPVEPGPDLSVSAPEGKSAAEIQAEFRPPPAPDEEEPEPQFQFTLLDLGLLTTFAAIGLAGARWLPGGYFATLAGVLAVITAVVGLIYQPGNRTARLLVWGMATIYVFAAIAAAVNNWLGDA